MLIDPRAIGAPLRQLAGGYGGGVAAALARDRRRPRFACAFPASRCSDKKYKR